MKTILFSFRCEFLDIWKNIYWIRMRKHSNSLDWCFDCKQVKGMKSNANKKTRIYLKNHFCSWFVSCFRNKIYKLLICKWLNSCILNLSGSNTKPSSMKNVGSVAILFRPMQLFLRRVRCPMLPKLPQEEAEKNIVWNPNLKSSLAAYLLISLLRERRFLMKSKLKALEWRDNNKSY